LQIFEELADEFFNEKEKDRRHRRSSKNAERRERKSQR
jgi:hypothetical protein